MSQIRNRISLTVALAGTLALAACSKPAAPPAPAPTPAPAPAAPAPAPVPPPAPAPAATVQIASVVLGAGLGPDGKIPAPTTAFSPKDTIYAVVAATNPTANTPVTARWTYQGGQLVSEQSGLLKDVGPAAVEFHINKPDGFPAGSYTVDILVGGKSLSTSTFTVK